MISTGIKYLDKITGGLRLGDNVVWQNNDGIPVEYFIKSFFKETNNFNNTIIYINFNYSPITICKRYHELFTKYRVILIDAFTNGKGNRDPVFLDFYKETPVFKKAQFFLIEDPKDTNAFLEKLNNVQLENKDGSFYIFDSLTGMSELWKDDEKVLDFFTFTCPKLYDLNTLAYWIYEKDAHSKKFIAGINHITQIVFSLSKTRTKNLGFNILKLEGRPSFFNNTPLHFKIIDETITFQEQKFEDLFRIGEKVKEQRKIKNITQTELASMLGMTSGAVSQIENSIISPSLQTLTQLASIFNKPLEYFINSSLAEQKEKGYYLFQNGKQPITSNKNVYIRKIFEEGICSIDPSIITIKAGKKISHSILLHKGMEFIMIIDGSIQITIEEKEHQLKKGDSILVTSSFIEKWENNNESDCELLYIGM